MMTVHEQVGALAQSIGDCAVQVERAYARGDQDSVEDCLIQIKAYAGELGYVEDPEGDNAEPLTEAEFRVAFPEAFVGEED